MKRLYIYFLLMSICAQAQDWQVAKNYGDEFEDAGTSIGVDKYGNSYVTGYRKYMTGGSCNGCYYQGQFYKFNSAGDIIWKKTIPYQGGKIVTEPEGSSYMVWGGRVIKYDSNGNQLWFLADSTIGVNSIALHPQGGFVISGATFNQKGIVARFDVDGNKLWESKKDFYHYLAGNVAVDKTGNVYFSGGYKPDTTTYNKGVLVKLDAQGNFLTYFLTPTSPDKMLAVDSSVYILRAGGEFEAENGIEPDNYNWHLIKYNQNGVIEWHKPLITKYIHKLTHITLDKDNNIFVIGGFKKDVQINQTQVTNTGNVDAFVFKINPLGDVKWTAQSTASLGGTVPFASIINTNNDVLITGNVTCFTADGFVDFGDTKISGVSMYGDLLMSKIKDNSVVGIKETYYNASEEFVVRPNPSHGVFEVSFSNSHLLAESKITVTNILGATLLSKNIAANTESNFSFDLTMYPRGVYFVTIQTQEFTETKKIIIQ